MSVLRIEIKTRFSGAVLFAHEAEGNTLRVTLEAAVSARANLDGANLDGANLAGAYLTGANLDGANLAGAYLTGANLDGANLAGAYLDGANLAGANLDGANLAGAYLTGAYLDGANLTGANLDGAKLREDLILRGERPIIQIGPIGSRCAYLAAFLTDKGLRIQAGCFFGTRVEFEAEVAKHHGDNVHAKEYRVALAMIGAHEELWAVQDEEEEKAA